MPRQLSRKESRELCHEKQGRLVQDAGTISFELSVLPEFVGFLFIMIGVGISSPSGFWFWLVFAFLFIVMIVLIVPLGRRKVVVTANGLLETRTVWRDLMGWENKSNMWFDWSEVNKMEFHSHYRLTEGDNKEFPALIITVKGNRYPYVCQLNTWGSGRRTMDKFRQMNYAISHYSGKPAHEINTTRHQYEVIFGTHADLGQRISEEEWESLDC